MRVTHPVTHPAMFSQYVPVYWHFDGHGRQCYGGRRTKKILKNIEYLLYYIRYICYTITKLRDDDKQGGKK